MDYRDRILIDPNIPFGKPIVRALNTVNVPLGIEAGLAIVIIAISLDRILKPRRRTVVKRSKE